MARLTNTGIEIVERDLAKIEKGLRGEAIPAILNAGADVLVKSWKEEITNRHRKTSQRNMMRDAVAKTEIRFDGDGASIEVYPQGTDTEHRITNAAKAFILHHGREGKRKIKGDKFVTAAENSKAAEVSAAMKAALDKYVRKE